MHMSYIRISACARNAMQQNDKSTERIRENEIESPETYYMITQTFFSNNI